MNTFLVSVLIAANPVVVPVGSYSNLKLNGDFDLNGNQLFDNTGPAQMGDSTGCSTNHGLTDGTINCQEAEFSGRVYLDNSLVLADNTFLAFYGLDATDTVLRGRAAFDQMVWGLGTRYGNQLIITGRQGDSQNYDQAEETDIKLCLFSDTAPNTANDEYGCFRHDQTEFSVTVGKGAFVHRNGKEAENLSGIDDPVTVTFSGGAGDASQTASNFRVAQRKIFGVSGRVVTTGTTCTSMDIGDGVDVDRYGDNIAVTDGTVFDIDDATADPEEFLTAAGDVVITGVGGNCVDLVVNLTLHWRGYQAATID